MTSPLAARIGALAAAEGPLSFSAYCDLALYDEVDGFYARGGAAGRRGDFLTSVEVGPLFGAVIARALDAWWYELGSPDPFIVVEAAAGVGTLARAIAKAAPACRGAMHYVAVERSAALRSMQPDWVESSVELPVAPFAGVVLANELLDNLTVDLIRWREESWHEIRVGEDAGRLIEVTVPASGELVSWVADLLDPHALVEGAEVAVQRGSAQWLSRALERVIHGRVVVFDYATTTSAMAVAPRARWLRTYRGHSHGGDPLRAPGTQDITCEVAVDQLATIAPPVFDRTQAAFLAEHGIDALVEEGRRIWSERTGPANLAALTGRSRIREAEALMDSAGLGGFRVLEWIH